jgi:site-specific DNA-methyltransferase (adenine-specific)
MKKMEDNFVDLTVTSPPYDNLRNYDSNSEWNETIWKEVIKELYRVTKDGGVVVWIVGDATIDGSETGSSFKQALWAMECGFKLHDTMIYEKNSSTYPAHRKSKRYTQIFEYMFVWVKGKINTCNLICDKKNKWAGHKDFSGILKNPVPEYSSRTNIWRTITSFNDKTGHPAVFPEQLVSDNIITWSNEGDLVYDPFMGSGTTAKMACAKKRNWIGSEISKSYFKMAVNRLKKYNFYGKED